MCVQLFHSLKCHAPGDSEWDDLVAFLQEFCSLAKHLQLQHRQNLWNKMTQLGMFEVSRAGFGENSIMRSSGPVCSGSVCRTAWHAFTCGSPVLACMH